MALEGKLKLAAEAGFEGFEIDLSEDGPVHLKSSSTELSAIKKLVRQYGLHLSGLATGLYWGANPASGDPQVAKRAATILERQVQAATDLGVDTILVVPGSVGVDFIPGGEVVPYDLAYERAVQFIDQALPSAEKAGVTIGIENVWNKFLLSPLEFARFLDSFGSKSIGAYFDVGNALATGYPEHWIKILGARIKRVHFKDYRRNVGSVDGFVDLLSGDVNWPEVMRSLRAIPYDGWCAAEMIPPAPFYKHAPHVLINNTKLAMQAIFDL